MEKLNDYLKDRKASELAEAVGISQGHLSDLRNGRRLPSFAVAKSIFDATDGAVDFKDWIL